MVEIFETGSCFKYLTTLAVLGSIRKASLGRNKNVVDNSPSNNKPHIQLHGVCGDALNYKKELNSGIHTKNLISQYHLKSLMCRCVVVCSWFMCFFFFFILKILLLILQILVTCLTSSLRGIALESAWLFLCVSVCMYTLLTKKTIKDISNFLLSSQLLFMMCNSTTAILKSAIILFSKICFFCAKFCSNQMVLRCLQPENKHEQCWRLIIPCSKFFLQ